MSEIEASVLSKVKGKEICNSLAAQAAPRLQHGNLGVQLFFLALNNLGPIELTALIAVKPVMLADKLVIEFAKISDAAEISRISRDEIEQGLDWSYTPQKLSRLIKDKTKNVVVARLDDTLAGFGIMTYHQDHANLDLLAVKQKFRRRKVGSQVLFWLEKVSATAGCFTVLVQVRETNTGAIAFYRMLGFQKLEIQYGYYQNVENAVIMAKSL